MTEDDMNYNSVPPVRTYLANVAFVSIGPMPPMMTAHECPVCGQECYCDGEDHHQEAPDDCCHECDEDGPWSSAAWATMPGHHEVWEEGK
jgi:hypothetical protein